jgi:hypothetical protein
VGVKAVLLRVDEQVVLLRVDEQVVLLRVDEQAVLLRVDEQAVLLRVDEQVVLPLQVLVHELNGITYLVLLQGAYLLEDSYPRVVLLQH